MSHSYPSAPGCLDTTVYQLAQPLVAFLNKHSTTSRLDVLSKKCLADIAAVIESVLTSQASLCDSNATPQLANTATNLSQTDFVQQTRYTRNAKDSLCGRRNAVVVSDDQKAGLSLAAVVQQQNNSSSRIRKRRILAAIHPYTELTEEESNTTAMTTLLGTTFNSWWFRWKGVHVVWSILGAVFGNVSATLYFLSHSFWQSTMWFPVLHAMYSALSFINYLGAFNANLFVRCLRTFDSTWIVLESILFGLSLWSIGCFRPQNLVISFAFISLSVHYIFYDCYPLSARLKTRPTLVLGFTTIAFYLGLLYSKSFEEHMCFYHIDLEHGLINDKELEKMNLQPSRWSVSLFEFCVNRAGTLLALMLRIVYHSYRHPEDCVIIKSRLRLIETPVVRMSVTPSK